MSLRRVAARLIAGVLLAATTAGLQAAGHRRALLVGINDYTASNRGTRKLAPPVPGRDLPNLTGAVNDVGILNETLQSLYGFEPADIITILDQAATRATI